MTAPSNYALIRSHGELEVMIESIIKTNGPFGIDIETGYSGPDKEGASLDPDYPDSFIVGISISGDPSWARYIPLAHDFSQQNLDQQPVAHLIWLLVMTGNAVIHNAAFELRFMARWFREQLGEDVVGDGYFPFLADSMLESYLAAETETHGLKGLTRILFGHEQAEITSLFTTLPKGKAMRSLRFNTLELTPEVVAYCCEDAAWCLAVHQYFFPKVENMLLYRVEHMIVPILCKMEDFGVQYDWPAMRAKAREAETFIGLLNTEIQQTLTSMTGVQQTINIGSPAQLRKVLYEDLGFRTSRKTATGAASTDEQALTSLAAQYPVVRKILEWKQLRKLVGTYLEKYERVYNTALDGRTHPDHNQVRVPSGRFAVADPPYQQSPKKYHYELEDGSVFECDFRTFIIAPPEHYIIGFDFSQVELRMLAGDSGEPALLNAFANDIDVHIATAALMLRKPLDQISKEDRARGKTMNFALLYGMGIASLAERLGVDIETAQALNDSYFAAYSRIDQWVNNTQALGRTNGFVLTRFGRKITIWEYQRAHLPGQAWQDSKGDRLSMNAPIQGAAADYMKIAMINADRAINAAGLQDRVHLVMNIHDALEFYVHESVSPQTVVDLLAPRVSFPVQGLPSIVAEWHKGTNWGNVTELRVVDGKLVDTGEAIEREEYAPDNDEAVETHADAGSDMRGTTKWEPEQALAPTATGTVQRLVVRTTGMPTPAGLQTFTQLVNQTPGETPVQIKIGSSSFDFPTNTGLGVKDADTISEMLGGATVAMEYST